MRSQEVATLRLNEGLDCACPTIEGVLGLKSVFVGEKPSREKRVRNLLVAAG